MTETDPSEQPEICAVWGTRKAGETHLVCDVVTTANHQRAGGAANPPPVGTWVCTCECTTCKRAWWAAGRPRTGPTAVVGNAP